MTSKVGLQDSSKKDIDTQAGLLDSRKGHEKLAYRTKQALPTRHNDMLSWPHTVS